MDETTGTSSYHMDENHSAGSELQRPQYGRRSWPSSEPSTLEIDVNVRRYALLVVLARNDDDDGGLPWTKWYICSQGSAPNPKMVGREPMPKKHSLLSALGLERQISSWGTAQTTPPCLEKNILDIFDWSLK